VKKGPKSWDNLLLNGRITKSSPYNRKERVGRSKGDNLRVGLLKGRSKRLIVKLPLKRKGRMVEKRA